jgi:hypothetical protein
MILESLHRGGLDDVPEEIVSAYMGIYSSDLDEHGRARDGTPSAGDPAFGLGSAARTVLHGGPQLVDGHVGQFLRQRFEPADDVVEAFACHRDPTQPEFLLHPLMTPMDGAP